MRTIKNSFRQFVFVQLLLMVMLLSNSCIGGEVVQTTYLNKPFIITNATLRLNDNQLKAEETANSTWYATKRKHQVRLTYHRESRTDVPSLSAWTYTVNYNIYQTGNAGSTTATGTLKVEHAPGSSNDIYEAIKEHIGVASPYAGYADVTVQITSISSTGTPPADIRIELSTLTERYTDIVAANTTVPLINYNATTTSELTWGFVPGAEEYDVEWTFIDYKDNHSAFTTPEAPFNYKAPVRVTTSNQYYVIDQVYPKGTLYFRVRGVGRHIDAGTDYTHVDVGNWGYKINFGSGTPPLSYTITSSYESNKNWSYTAAYAEDGKSKKGIGYTDGGGKLRQSQATMNSDNTVVVGENKYDLEGRPVIAVMPVPVAVTTPSSAFGYRTLFNTASGASEYDHSDFELGTTPLGNTIGAGKYYSDQNPFLSTDAFAAYTSDAGGSLTTTTTDGGYPFTQVQYTRDNTGRVSKTTGGAGDTYVLGNGHDLGYFYGSANSTELHRMFGTNVGKASHYKKNLAADANGQVSISYYDQEERVIATCLAGTAPDNLMALESNVVTEITVSLNGNNVVNPLQHESHSISNILNVVPNTPHSFSYDMKGVIYGTDIIINGMTDCMPVDTVPVCADCKYILKINITDPDGLTVSPANFSVAPSSVLPDYSWNFSNPNNPNCANNQYTETPITFSISCTKIGNYTVSKTLTLDTTGIYLDIQDAIQDAGLDNEYRDSLISCLINTTDFGECDITCGQHCRTEILRTHPTWAADTANYSAVITNAVNQCITAQCNPGWICKDNCRVQVLAANPIWAADTAYYATDINTAVAACVTLQCGTVAATPCEEMLKQMIIDVSPGGREYMESFTLPTTPFLIRVNELLTFHTGCTDPNSPTCIYIVDTTGGDTVAINSPFDYPPEIWPPEWTLQLVKAHRDYCHYLACIAGQGKSSSYDVIMTQVPDWDSANTLGMLDPLGFGRVSSSYAFPAGVGSSGPDVVVNTLTTAFDPAFIIQPDSADECSGYDLLAKRLLYGFRDINNDTIDIWHYVFDSTSVVYDTMGFPYTKENMWKVFRGLYLAKKIEVDNILYPEIKVNVINVCTANEFGYYSDEGNCLVYQVDTVGVGPCAICPTYPDSDVYPPKKTTGSDKDIQDAYNMVADCAEKCSLNAIYWIDQLKYFADSSGCTNWNNLSAANKDAIKHNLLLFCQSNCGLKNPVGYILGTDLSPTMNTYLSNVQTILSTAGCSTALNYLSAGDPYEKECPTKNGAPVKGTFPNECFKQLITYINGTVLPSSSTCFTMSGDSLQTECLGGNYLNVSGTDFRLSKNSNCSYLNCQIIRFYNPDGTAINVNDISSISIPKFVLSSPIMNPPSDYTFKNLNCVVNTTNNGPSLAYVYIYRYCAPISLLKSVEITDFCIMKGLKEPNHSGIVVNYDSLKNNCIQVLMAHDTVEGNRQFNILVNAFKNQYLQAHYNNCFSDDLYENFYYEYNSNEYHYTLYYYDQAGNLTQTVPPKGVHLVPLTAFTNGVYNNSTEPAHTYLTRYGYNSLNQVVLQETPDGGRTNYHYDDKGRLRFSKNDKQRLGDLYSYTMYDELSRIIEVGQSDQQYTGSIAFYNGVNDPAFPNSNRSQATITTYDAPAATGSIPSGIFAGNQQFLRTRVATTQFYEGAYTGTATGLSAATHYSYDEHGNVNELVQENTLLASLGNDIKYKYMKYNYQLISGNVKEVAYQPGKADQFYHRYIYDADNRLTIAMTSNHAPLSLSFDTGWEKDAKYFYYKHGLLARVETGEDKVQGTDYAYTINGWMKGINATTLKTSRDMGKDGNLSGSAMDATNNNNLVGIDALGYTLGYFDGDYTSVGTSTWQATTAGTSFSTGSYKDLFNGNIARTTSAFMDNSEAAVTTMGKSYVYDQLNRLKSANAFINVTGGPDQVLANNTFASASDNSNYKELFSYDANGNISHAERWGHNAGGTQKMDEFIYNYEDIAGGYSNNTNKLRFVGDAVTSTNYTEDIDDQAGSFGFGSENYEYDLIGNLTGDQAEEINSIAWNIYGKVTAVSRTTASNRDDLEFKYDPSGNRICKIVKPRASSAQKTEQFWTYTYYVHDPQGNVTAVYNRDVNDLGGGSLTDVVSLKEHDIYGISRIGIETKNVSLGGKDYAYSSLTYTDGAIDRPASPSTISSDAIGNPTRLVGDKHYELSNHLGSVMVVCSDKKIGVHTSGSSSDAEYYMADVISSTDYFSYGATTPGRRYNTTGTEFGFSGKREDAEIYGEGNSYDFGSRINDPRLGRFLSVDPLSDKYPGYSPYLFAGNKPIWMIDKDGEEEICYTINISKGGKITYKITYYGDNDFIPDFKEVIITYEGEKVGTYLFTAVGTNGDHSSTKPEGGGHNNLDQFDEFIGSLIRNPNGTMQNPDYTTTEEIKKDMLKEIAASILLAKLTKQRDRVNPPPAPNKKPYSNPANRPKYGAEQDEKVWNAAKQADGKVYDPNTGEELTWDRSKPRNGQWDMGHKPGEEYRKTWKDYMDGKITPENFLEKYRNPDNYRPESPGANRSRKYEKKDQKKAEKKQAAPKQQTNRSRI